MGISHLRAWQQQGGWAVWGCHPSVWHDAFIRVTLLTFVRDRGGEAELYACAIQVCDMTHSYVWHDAFICVTEAGRQSCMSVLFKSNATQCFCPTPAFENFAKRCVYISVRVYTWLSCMSVLLKLSATQCFCSTPEFVNFAPRCVYIYIRVCTYTSIWDKRYSVLVPDASVRELCGKVHYIYMYMCVHIQLIESSATSCFCLTPAFVDCAERCTICVYVCVHIQIRVKRYSLLLPDFSVHKFCERVYCAYICMCVYICACACALFLCRTPVCANFANSYILHIYLCVYMHMYTYMCVWFGSTLFFWPTPVFMHFVNVRICSIHIYTCLYIYVYIYICVCVRAWVRFKIFCKDVNIYYAVFMHIWMSHVTHMNKSCHTYIWMSHVTHINESCHTYIWMSHVTHINKSCHTYIWMSHVTHINKSCHTYIWMSHVTHINTSCHTYIWMSHVTHIDEYCRTASKLRKRVNHIANFENMSRHAHDRVLSSFTWDILCIVVFSLICASLYI